jgi:hypothetical protein
MGEDDKVGVGVGNNCVFFNDALTCLSRSLSSLLFKYGLEYIIRNIRVNYGEIEFEWHVCINFSSALKIAIF